MQKGIEVHPAAFLIIVFIYLNRNIFIVIYSMFWCQLSGYTFEICSLQKLLLGGLRLALASCEKRVAKFFSFGFKMSATFTSLKRSQKRLISFGNFETGANFFPIEIANFR